MRLAARPVGAASTTACPSSSKQRMIALIVVAAAALGMICYLKYYELEPMTAFYDGMVPLILFAVVMAGIVVFQLRSGS